jgi:hypothetical protein
MSSACSARAPKAMTIESLDRPLEIAEDFTLSVLGEDSGSRKKAQAIKIVGRRLIARVGERLSAGTAIRIDCEDAFLMGEVLGCWQERGAIFIALDLHHALTRLAELAELRDEWREPQSEIREIRTIRHSA